jgi:hypothetical protein
MVTVVPGLYGIVCWMRRGANARKTAKWVRENYEKEWNSLHWLAKRNSWACVEVLITKGLISGPEVEEYRSRDEYLEKATWVGLLLSAVLSLIFLALHYVVSTFG